MKAAEEATRILRRVESGFPVGKTLHGSGFVGGTKGDVITSAHLIRDEGYNASTIKVNGKMSSVQSMFSDIDVAVLQTDETEVCHLSPEHQPTIGEDLYFSGYPSGVRTGSFFAGILSAYGPNLISNPSCEVYQINGMINAGNSGGPLLDSEGRVIGVITAKFVPLLLEVDKLLKTLKEMPQFPSEVGIGKVDFAKFVNMVIKSLTIISGSLRLVQVGTGYAVPIRLLEERRRARCS